MMEAVSEAELRALSSRFGGLVSKTRPMAEQELKTLKDLLQQLFVFAEATQITLSYRAAACNALCGFVDATSTSNVSQVKSVSLNTLVWNRMLSLYLDRFQDASTRSMKQILATLLKMVALWNAKMVGTDGDKWIEDASILCIRYISSSADLSCVKPSMLLLKDILSKGLQSRDRFLKILSTVQQNLSVRLKAATLVSPGSGDSNQSLQRFVLDILRWSRNSDLCLAGGRLMGTLFFKHTRNVDQDKCEEDDLLLQTSEPIWLQPILDLINEEAIDLEKIEKYILLELLAANERNILHLSRKLPVHQLLHHSNRGIRDSNIRLALLLVGVMETKRLSDEISEYEMA